MAANRSVNTNNFYSPLYLSSSFIEKIVQFFFYTQVKHVVLNWKCAPKAGEPRGHKRSLQQ